MLHQKLCAANGIFQRNNLSGTQLRLAACGLHLRKSVIHLTARIEQSLLKGELRLFLLGFGYLQLCNVQAFIKQRLRQCPHSGKQQLAGIDNHIPGRVCPACRTAQRDGRIKRRTCRIGTVKGRRQRKFRTLYVRTTGKELQRHPYRQIFGKVLPGKVTALYPARHFSEKNGKTVLHFLNLLLQVQQGSLNLTAVGFGLGDGRFIRHTGSHHGTHGTYAFAPVDGGFLGNTVLLVEH